jgi:hypothetical protein
LRVAASTTSTASRARWKEQAVARLDVTQAPVVALERLLRLDEALLQGGQGAQVAPHEHHGAVGQAHARVGHRQVVTVGRGVIDLAARRGAPYAGRAPGRLAEEQLDLAARLGRDDVGEPTAHPPVEQRRIPALRARPGHRRQARGAAAAGGRVDHHAGGVDDQGEVGGGDEAGRRLAAQARERGAPGQPERATPACARPS